MDPKWVTLGKTPLHHVATTYPFYSVSSSLLTPCLRFSTTQRGHQCLQPPFLLNYINIVGDGSAMVLGGGEVGEACRASDTQAESEAQEGRGFVLFSTICHPHPENKA